MSENSASEKPASGEMFGVPYNFERPSLSRMLSSYWQPGEDMLVEKPFGIGYTLNLANPRSWVVVGVAVALLLHERSGSDVEEEEEAEPVEVLVDED